MRFPSFALAAIAGLWQNPIAPEETVTSSRHAHVTRTVTDVQHTIFAMRIGSSTVYMEYLPASITAKTSSGAVTSTPNSHLELRSVDVTRTAHVKVTMTVESVEATVYASSVGTSVATLTSVPASLVAEASAEVAAEASSQAAAVSSAEAAAMVHSTVTALAAESTAASLVSQPGAQTANVAPTNQTNTMIMIEGANSSSQTSQAASITRSSGSSATGIPPLGLELRSDGDTTSTSHIHLTVTVAETQSTVYEMALSSSTSSMTSVPTSIVAIASSEAAEATQSTIAVDAAPASETTSIASSSDVLIKSTQNALLAVEITSDTASSTVYSSSSDLSSTLSPSTSTAISTSSFVSTRTTEASSTAITTTSITSSTSSHTLSLSTSDTAITTLTTRYIPSTHTTSSTTETTISSTAAATSSDGSSPTYTSDYEPAQASSSAAAAEIAADNAAGASGSDSGSFKLSKGGFAAIISVVSIGVGLGMIFLVLFVVAKRRQWHVRASIARASRRFTGRFPATPKHKVSEKGPTLPTIQPSSTPIRPARLHPMNAHRGIDAQIDGYRGVQTVRTERGPGVWRQQMGVQGQRAVERVGAGGLGGRSGGGLDGRAESRLSGPRQMDANQKKKPELRVDTQLAREMEEGGVRQQRGQWRDLLDRFRGRNA